MPFTDQAAWDANPTLKFSLVTQAHGEALAEDAFRAARAAVHEKDEDCAQTMIFEDGCMDRCGACGVSFNDFPCPDCGKRGFHADGCAEGA